MADEADRAQILEEAERDHCVKTTAKDLAKGEPGQCIECGAHSARLLFARCAPCREQLARDAERRAAFGVE